MADDNKQQPEDDQAEDSQPNPGPTKRLEKAIEDMESGDHGEGTLVSIDAHTGEHPQPAAETEPSVTEALKQAKGKSAAPDVKPASAMYDPPVRENRPPSGSGNVAGSGGSGRPVAPFGGKIMVGTRVGQIEVTGVLGKGGMGEVFKGYHHALDINVAIKVLPDELSRNELVRQRFLREARLCVKLDHPHVVRVYNVDEYAGNLFLVMEMIDGTDSADMLKEGGRFRYRRALEIGAASADALAYAHSQGLVHRDVKPHNILLGAQDGKIKLSDFGLARAATSASHLTMSGQIMGTPHYMSPEQAEAKEVTDKSDVYSLGVTLYHMLTGETPFVGDTPISVAVQHIAKEIIYPENRFKAFPKELVAVLKRMTAKDPAKRCSGKQAAVWLNKLIGMAPQDDIEAEGAALQTLAPVVRESQAFEQAQKDRAQRDHQAREQAQTMLATIQEQSARRAAVETMREAPVSAPTPQPVAAKSGGMGKMAAAAVVLLLVGGGAAAGWYFGAGPGKAMLAGNDKVASDGEDKNDDSSSDGTSSDGRDSSSTDGAADGVIPGDGGNDDGRTVGTDDGGIGIDGGDDGASNDGADDAGPDDGGITTPPPEEDNPLVKSALDDVETAITTAKTLDAIEKAGRDLNRARAGLDKASAKQRERFKGIHETYEKLYALIFSTESFDAIDAALEKFETTRNDQNWSTAITSLNSAIAERDKLIALEVPEAAAEMVNPDRDAFVGQVNTALDEFWNELEAEVSTLVEAGLFDGADDILAVLEQIDADAERRDPLPGRRHIIQTRGRHKRIIDELDGGKYKSAIDKLKEAEKAGIPESLKDEHAQVATKVENRVGTALEEYLASAAASLAEKDFDAARNDIDDADKLPLNNDQYSRVADLLFNVNVTEQIHNAELAIAEDDFTGAKASLTTADELIQNVTNRTIPAELSDEFFRVSKEFDAQLGQRFANLLAAAKAEMDEQDFESAAINLDLANDLPLTETQQTELEEFKQQNEEALANYVRGLIGDIEAALDSNDFEAALKALETANALKIPADMVEKLEGLQQRFSTEAVKRHSELLVKANDAIEKRNYADARDALNSAKQIPVAESRKAEAIKLEEKYVSLLTTEVTGHLDSADTLLESNDFVGAKREIENALALPLTEDLNRQVKKKLEEWNESLESTFSSLLESAKTARASNLLRSSAGFLAEAEDLPLSQEQLIRLSDAQDEHEKAVDAYKDGLFKDLEGAVDKGDEKAGKDLIAKLEKLGLSPIEQLKLKRLKARLTGETDSARRARLPSHLKKLFNDRYCESEQLISIGEEITALAVTSDGKFAAVGTESGKVHIYNLKRGTQVGSSSAGRRKVTALTLNTDGSLAAAGNDDGELVLFRINGTSVSANALGNAGDELAGLGFSTNGNVLFAATTDADLIRYNPTTKAKLGSVATGLDRAECMQISPNGDWVAIGGDEARVALFDANRMLLKQTLEAPGDDLIQRVAFSADSLQVMAGSIDSDVGTWQINRLTKKPRKEYSGLSEWVRGVGFSQDGRRCAAFDNEYRVVVWDSNSGTELRRLEYSDKLEGEKEFWATAGIIGPDGTILIGTREGELVHLSLQSAG